MKVSVGLPLYDGKLDYRLAQCLLTETTLALKSGDQLHISCIEGCSDLARGRNQIVHEFLEGECDRLVFLDADITFEPGDLLRIAHYPEDFVGGVYRYKDNRAVRWPMGFIMDGRRLQANEHGLLEVAMVPTGFLSLSRDVFRRLKEAHPGRTYENNGVQQHCFFQFPYVDGALYGEDAYFCREWKEIGGQVFVAPEFNLTHWKGNIPHEGRFGDWLNRSAGLPTRAEKLKQVQEGTAPIEEKGAIAHV